MGAADLSWQVKTDLTGEEHAQLLEEEARPGRGGDQAHTCHPRLFKTSCELGRALAESPLYREKWE